MERERERERERIVPDHIVLFNISTQTATLNLVDDIDSERRRYFIRTRKYDPYGTSGVLTHDSNATQVAPSMSKNPYR